MKPKRIYNYYIDESGHINNDQPVFLYGCLKTDTPNLSVDAIKLLKEELKDELYFIEYLKEIEKGFHACENHPDIRTHFYKILPILNYRVYFEVIYKKSPFFIDLKNEKQDFEIISKMLKNLINKMVLKDKNAKHIFYVEELEIQNKSLAEILKEIFESYHGIEFEYYIVPKGDENLSITDYINYNLFNIFVESDEKKFKEKNVRVINTFNILKEKIALIHIWNNDSFYSRKGNNEKHIEIDNLRKVMAEV
ncbi:DUF3800 domain-containing protein [Flavobacterium channae]|uniref:DUF3800 domain-containing protein n=1 Tax=Flavobacterium channae TaxID=2897181 RepID=UPI001E4AD661|nr:DUF3800 domain-containing protein [Flavobacterium channae]UGS24765.1 hypothetical protein LOS89_05695 [Flavobacterium channae]